MGTAVKGYLANGAYPDFDDSDPDGPDGPPVGATFVQDGQEWVVTARTARADGATEVLVACVGCCDSQVPGVRWPAAPDGDTSHAWVERCDRCETFASDQDAADHVARQVGGHVAHARAGGKHRRAYVDVPA